MSYQYQNSLHQKLGDILALFSRAGILVEESRIHPFFVDLVLSRPVEPRLFKDLYTQLLREYNVVSFQLKGDKPVVRLVPFVKKESTLYRHRWLLTTTAFVTIFFTGLGVAQGLTLVTGDQGPLILLTNAALYTLFFSLALLVHEFGHLYVSRRAGLIVEGPVLLPAPPIQLGFLGTFGAVIYTKTPPCTKKDLAKLGLSGPIFGLAAATVIGIVGTYLSPVISYEAAAELVEKGSLELVPVASLGLILMQYLRPLSPQEVLVMHPLLFVTYVMYLITFINLLPIGQLDGGHVVRSAIGLREFNLVSSLVPAILIGTGLALVFAGFSAGAFNYYIGLGAVSLVMYLLFGRRGHPGTANQYDESTCRWCLLGYLLALILTAPVPLVL